MHSGCSNFNGLTIGILLWADQTTVSLGHVLFHNFIISIEFLTHWFTNVTQLLRGDKIEFAFALLSTIWLDQLCLVTVVDVLDISINRCYAILEFTFLME